MTDKTLAIRLPIRTNSPGVGFANVPPLPEFVSGLGQLHLLRRSTYITSWNRVTLERETVVIGGAVAYEDDAMRAEDGSAVVDIGTNLNWDGGFTIGLVYQAVAGADRDPPLLSTADQNSSGGDRRGFYISTHWSDGAPRLYAWFAAPSGMNTRDSDYTGALEATLVQPTLLFLTWDGVDTAYIYFPHADQGRDIVMEGDPNDAPDPTAPLRLFSRGNPLEGDGLPDGRAAHLLARWDRELSVSEMQTAHQQIKAWLMIYDVDIA